MPTIELFFVCVSVKNVENVAKTNLNLKYKVTQNAECGWQ